MLPTLGYCKLCCYEHWGKREILYDLTYKWNLINKAYKQNITRDIDKKNKLTVTRGDNGGRKVKGHQGTCIKDPRTKPKGGGIDGRRWEWVGPGTVVGGKWKQLYLNTMKKEKKTLVIYFKKASNRLGVITQLSLNL